MEILILENVSCSNLGEFSRKKIQETKEQRY